MTCTETFRSGARTGLAFSLAGPEWTPQGPATGNERILRSGSWLDDPYTIRSAYRYFAPPDNLSGTYGFRVVLAPAQ